MNMKTRPEGWRILETLDFVHNKKLLKIIAVSGLIVTVLAIIAGFILQSPAKAWRLLLSHGLPWAALVPMLIAYILLHELTHGVLMHLLSGVKPKYGMRLCYAYAGSDVWFDRPSHVAIALAPVILWGAVLGVLCANLPPEWFWPLWIVQISNLSGAVGDVWCAVHLIRVKGDILIRDTGTRMTVITNT